MENKFFIDFHVAEAQIPMKLTIESGTDSA